MGGAGDDQLFGGAGDDRLFGQGGNDTLFGGSDDDLIRGGFGDDRLEGGAGKDELLGDSGDDVLVGGAEADRLSGGGGADRFVYEDLLDLGDKIIDFNPLQDVIDVSALANGNADAVRVVDAGLKAEVYLETSGSTEVKVAELLWVDAGQLVVGDDPGANILV